MNIEQLDSNMARHKADTAGIVWLDPRSPPFRLAGFAWAGEDGETTCQAAMEYKRSG